MGGGKIVNFKIYALIRYLEKPGGVTVDTLVHELDVSRSSVYRYLQVIQNMGFPVASEIRNRMCYYFFDMTDEKVVRNIAANLPILSDDMMFDKDEKLLIEYLFENAAGIPALHHRMDKLYEKMQLLLTFAGYASQDNTDDKGFVADKRRAVRRLRTFSDMAKNSESDRVPLISRLCDAVCEKKVCHLVYSPASTRKIEEYDIMPLLVFSYMGGIYLVAERDDKDHFLEFSIERMISLEVLDRHFEKKTDFDEGRFLSDPFGLVQDKKFTAVIRISKRQVGYIQDRQWPEGRVSFSEPDENGDVLFSITTMGTYEILRWLRYQGSCVELLEPKWLRQELIESIDALREVYR